MPMPWSRTVTSKAAGRVVGRRRVGLFDRERDLAPRGEYLAALISKLNKICLTCFMADIAGGAGQMSITMRWRAERCGG